MSKRFCVRIRMTTGELIFLIALVAIFLVVLFNTLSNRRRPTTQEFVLQTQINNLEIAVEMFKIRFGFYPPDFTDIRTVDDFKPLLIRLAPEQKEVASGGLDIWWNSIGCRLGPRTALFYWLTSLSDDPNYPLTYFDPDSGARKALPVGVSPVLGESGSSINITRIVFLDFSESERKPTEWGASTIRQHGSENEVLYFSSPYRFETKDLKGESSLPFYYYDQGNRVYYNPDSYQIYAPGIDGKYVDPSSSDNVDPYDLSSGVKGAARDNYCNFSNGRMELLDQ